MIFKARGGIPLKLDGELHLLVPNRIYVPFFVLFQLKQILSKTLTVEIIHFIYSLRGIHVV